MRVEIIGVPTYYGCDIKGVENGPDILRRSGLINLLNEELKVFDIGNINVISCDSAEKYKDSCYAKYLSPLIELNENLAKEVNDSLNRHAFPLIIGGDHSISIGSIAGLSNYYKQDLAVIWIDAHGDMNTFDTSPSANIHGMPLAASMGIGDASLTKIYFEGAKVNPKNVFLFCVRDLDEGEKKLIKDLDINIWTSNDIKEKGIYEVIAEFIEKFRETCVNNIHISFDIDSIDASLISGTGTPVKDGVTIEEVKILLRELFNTKKVRSLDFVEFNGHLDDENQQTLQICKEMLKDISNFIFENIDLSQ